MPGGPKCLLMVVSLEDKNAPALVVSLKRIDAPRLVVLVEVKMFLC